MPELPEVETVKSVLEKVVIGHTITGIDVLRDSAIHGNVRDFISELVGEKYESISRIGKFLIFHLTNEKVIVSHLRMEGKYYEVKEDEPNTKYSRVALASRVATRVSWSPLSGHKGVQPPLPFGERTRDCSPGHAGKEGPQLARTGASPGIPRAAAPVGVFSRGTTRISGSLSWGAREVRSPCAWRGGARPGSRVTGGD